MESALYNELSVFLIIFNFFGNENYIIFNQLNKILIGLNKEKTLIIKNNIRLLNLIFYFFFLSKKHHFLASKL